MATIGQQLLQPESGWRRYDNTHLFIGYSNGWLLSNTNNYYNGTIAYSNSSSGTIKIVFKGTKIRLLGATNGAVDTVGSDNVTIKIDGISEKYSNYSPSVAYQVVLYESTELTKGIHLVEIEKNDNNYAWIDAIDIDADGELIRHDYFDNLPYDEPMRKYGVAWFGFDEASGNVYDKLGSNYVGTVTGATRVDGWNGEGNAMNFNGNQLCQINNNFQMDELTYRFKVRKSLLTHNNTGYDAVVFNTNSRNLTGSGVFADISPNKSIRFMCITNNNLTSIILEGTKNIVDEKWHDVIINYKNGSHSSMYIDGNLEAKMSIPVLNITHKYNTFTLGRITDANIASLNGQLDDLQIYSKALTPSDFIQNHIAIKTQGNKNLVLPNREGRVKEIPSSEESDLISQGYTWREIDNAVDGGIDLTQPTTEYEIVGSNPVQIGSGKMITIPLPNDFKTIKVENNE